MIVIKQWDVNCGFQSRFITLMIKLILKCTLERNGQREGTFSRNIKFGKT